MTGDLTDAVYKLRWAYHQIATLHGAVTAYVNSEPYVDLIEDHPESQGYKVVAHLRYPPPPSLGLIASDFLSSLHGALDFMAAQLVEREGGTVFNRTTFPIKKPNANGTEPEVNIAADGCKEAIQDPDVVKALRAVQPYQDGADAALHPLWVLRVLNGHSKHRHIPILSTATANTTVVVVPKTFYGVEFPPGARVGVVTPTFSAVKDGAELAWISYVDAPDGPPPYEVEFAPLVTLEQGPPGDLLSGLASLFEYVHVTVFPRFAGFFASCTAAWSDPI